jgi:hypothetical protein
MSIDILPCCATMRQLMRQGVMTYNKKTQNKHNEQRRRRFYTIELSFREIELLTAGLIAAENESFIDAIEGVTLAAKLRRDLPEDESSKTQLTNGRYNVMSWRMVGICIGGLIAAGFWIVAIVLAYTSNG